ncbi:molybdopterin molybdotransferase MoeA [Nocardiopsis sp. B62]|uniref:molybdopterin molybdotransferase MoeA n=1 Tax=Nocardiopsis sp. B62 TaxID=2824874 RepID=UPI001B38896A|nr:molybdopterin-binding protein [Nocardiopsis sp. B62]MBQ1081188.1 molybdopterin molybdenumtransferase MoeA [Nocardiopsis sp. B62]
MPDSGAWETSPLLRDRRPSGGHTPTPWPRARELAREIGAAAGAPAEDVPLAEARGATLGADLVSAIDVPVLDSAAMDGYAVSGEGPWLVLGRSLAGHPGPVVRLNPGEAVETATGAVAPDGTTAVLPRERATLAPPEPEGTRGLGDPASESDVPPAPDGARLLYGEVTPGRHLRRRGETTLAGTVAARAGSPVTPALLGLAASLGNDSLPVLRPRVRVLVTGDEVVHAGVPRPGAVRDAIGPVLPGLAAWAGGRCEPLVAVADRGGALEERLDGAAGTDTVAVCGSSSTGPADHLRAALTALGANFVVDGVACRPGHPQLLAVLPSGTVVVGLPGNPGAALAAALTLLVPVLSGRADRRDPAHTGRRVRLVGDVRPHASDTRLLPVRVSRDLAVELPASGSADLRAAAVADALAVVPPGRVPGRVELVGLPV